jgi:transposase
MSQEVFVGVDLAKEFHQVMAVGSDHQVLAPTFRIGRGRSGMQEMIERLRFLVRQESDLVFTIEATSDYWWELVWELGDRGCVVYLAHPKKAHDLRKFYALHTKTDVTDAEALARMPLVDTNLQSLWRPSVAVQSLQRLCRLRWKSRCRIADLKRRLSHLSDVVVPGLGKIMPVRYSKSARVFLRRYLAPERARRLGKKRLGMVLSKAAWGKFSQQKLDLLWECVLNAPRLGLQPEDLLLEVGLQLDEIEALEKQIAQLDGRIAELYGEVDPAQCLLVVPGLGEFLAAAITAVIGDVRRFPSAKHLVSYSGLAPRVKSSGGQTRARQGITKHGSPYLRAWAYLAAENSRQYDPELKAYYQRMRQGGKHYLTAMCATAARLLERVYGILSEQVEQKEKESQAQSVCTG